MNIKPENFGQFVQQKRLEKALTQKQLGSKVGCSIDTIRAMEQNRPNYLPSSQMITSLAQALDVSEDELKSYLKAKENIADDPPKRKPGYVLVPIFVVIVIVAAAAFFIMASSVNPAHPTVKPTQTKTSTSTPMPAPIGAWVGTNYLCGGQYYTERVRLEWQGTNYLVATKLDGDICVGAGQRTLEGLYDNPTNTFPYTFAVKLWVKGLDAQMTPVDRTAVMVNPDRIEIRGGSYVLVFRSANAITETPTPTQTMATPTITITPLQNVTGTLTPGKNSFTKLFYVKPTLNPIYSGDLCVVGWLRIDGWQDDPSYLTLNTNQPSSSGYTATYSVTVEKAGYYQLSNWVAHHSPISWSCPTKIINGDSSETPFRINHANGESVVYINQSQIADDWATIGQYYLNAGTTYNIIIFDLNKEADLSTTLSVGTLRLEYVP